MSANSIECEFLEIKPSLVYDRRMPAGGILEATRKSAPMKFESNFLSESRRTDTFFSSLHNTNDVDKMRARYDSRPFASNANMLETNSQMRAPVYATNDQNWQTYLDRQGRNEYITLASQIAYNGNNTAFIFFENQKRRLMEERPMKNADLKFCELLAWGNLEKWLTCFVLP